MATYREIPEGSMEIQTGLWMYSYERTINGTTYLFRHLYSSEGYCFYDTALDMYDEEGNMYPRMYYTYMSLAVGKSLDTIFSVPVQDDYEIAGGGNNMEIA